jgi:dihydroorotase-like cyclic amidohydrolase
MTVDLTLRGGVVVTPGGPIQGGIAVEDGVIVAIGRDRALPHATSELDLRGQVVIPGMIDPHVHLGVGGSADDAKFLDDLSTETRAAALGGITTIVSDHENAHGESWVTLRERDGEALFEQAKRQGEARSPIDFRFTANPCRERDLDEIAELARVGVTSFKMFPSYVGDEAAEFGITTVGYDYIFEACERIAAAEQAGTPTQAMVHCEEPSICGMLKARFRRETDELEAWTRSRPATTEAMQVLDVGMIALETGARMYIPHVSSEEAGRAIEYLQSRGSRISGETCPHYLLMDPPWQLGGLAKVNPPIRGPEDAAWMWEAIRRGTISALGSDDCRYSVAEKAAKSIWDVIPGFSEIGATLPLMLTEGIAAGRISWIQLASIGAEGPARCFGMYPKKGALLVGSDADLVVVDPQERWRIGVETPMSGADYSIYSGREIIGRPTMTISRGRLVMERGRVLEPGGGRYVASGETAEIS